jgi:hypothetical protein
MCHVRGSGSCYLPFGLVSSSRKELWIPCGWDETPHNFRFYARGRKPANSKLRRPNAQIAVFKDTGEVAVPFNIFT